MGETLAGGELPALEAINVGYNGLGDRGAVALARASWLRLQSLVVCKTDMGDEGAVALAQAPWPLMQSFDFSLNRLSHRGFTALVDAKWPDLRQLKVQDLETYGPARVTFSVEDVLSQGNWPRLEVFSCNWGVEETFRIP